MTRQLQKFVFIILLMVSTQSKAQFTFSDIKYFLGTGTDTTMLVVDFHDGSFWDTCYAWGYIHNAGATGVDMLNAVAAADANLSVNIAGGSILNDITYGSHSGIGGTNGFYWSTWDGTTIANLAMNGGVSTALTNGGIFACSFTDFSPAVAPGNPIPAFDPFYFTAQDVDFWIGTGSDTTVLVIDFLDGSGTSSFAWGYLYDGIVTAEQMMNAIDAVDTSLMINISGGLLNSISYGSFYGPGNGPNYWGSWTATNFGNWWMNMGVTDTIFNGSFFGCTHTDFAPPVRPDYPQPAVPVITGISSVQNDLEMSVYPNPASEFVNIRLSNKLQETTTIHIVDVTGKTVLSQDTNLSSLQLPVQQLPAGIYSITVTGDRINYSKNFIKL